MQNNHATWKSGTCNQDLSAFPPFHPISNRRVPLGPHQFAVNRHVLTTWPVSRVAAESVKRNTRLPDRDRGWSGTTRPRRRRRSPGMRRSVTRYSTRSTATSRASCCRRSARSASSATRRACWCWRAAACAAPSTGSSAAPTAASWR